MAEYRRLASATLRGIAGILAFTCAFTAFGSLAVCLFTTPEAWFMVVFWAAMACVFGACSRWGRSRA